MTTQEERECYYRLAREQADKGVIVEMGCWLGASTSYIAKALQDSGASRKVHVYDRFQWDPSHEAKGAPSRDLLGSFKQYLGPHIEHVEIHQGEIAGMKWGEDAISLIVFDAPKRVPAISAALTAIAHAVRPGTLMAWQDFAHFPSYDIPACISSLGSKVEMVEAVYPGTTAVFRVVEPWSAQDVSERALALTRWTADEIEQAWWDWGQKLHAGQRPRFACGATMFLHDIGETEQAVATLRTIVADYGAEVMPKWRYLARQRGGLTRKYAPLFAAVDL